MLLSDSSHVSIAVALNLFTTITFLAIKSSSQSPFPFKMIFLNTVIVHIMACRVFRNVKLGRHSQILVMPTPVNPGNLEQHQWDYKPRLGEENSHHMGEHDHADGLFSPGGTAIASSKSRVPTQLGITSLPKVT